MTNVIVGEPRPRPRIATVRAVCERCRAGIWIPRASHSAMPTAVLMCFACAVDVATGPSEQRQQWAGVQRRRRHGLD